MPSDQPIKSLAPREHEEWPLEQQVVVLESVPPDLARVFVAHHIKTWADAAAEFSDALLLTYSGIGSTTLRWFRYELQRRRNAVTWPATGQTKVPMFARFALPNAAPTRAGVYFIQCGPFVKIGLTRNVRLRFQAIQQAMPFPLTLLGVIEPGPSDTLRGLEATFHARFQSAKHVGEWFRLEGELDVFCLALASGQEPVGT